MTNDPVPVNNVCYWIQNLDFGTFLGLVDEWPVNRTTNRASFVVRPKKENIPTQEWILQDFGNEQWAIINHGSTFFVDGNNQEPTLTFFKSGGKLPDAAKVTIERENETNIVKIKTRFGSLQTTNGFDLSYAEDDDVDRMKWRLIPKAPVLAQTGYRYRLRALNGRVLNLNSAGQFNAEVLSDSLKDPSNISLWTIEPAEEGKCTIQQIHGGPNDYLSCTTRYVQGQSNFIVTKGPAFSWDVESIGNFGYQFLRNDRNFSLAITVENDTEVILKPNKVGHGQIWLLERDYN